VRRHGLKIRWFNEWTAVLGRALEQLPESTECPHELFVAIMQNPSRARKSIALVTEGDQPVAVIGLRSTGFGRWDIIGGGGVSPRFLAHAVDGYLFPALSALGVNVHISTQTEQPPEQWVRQVVAHPVFRIALSSDYEAYWRESGQWSGVREARKRTKDLVTEIDGPGAAEWTIRNWAAHWHSRATTSEDDLVLAAEYYRRIGRFHTIRLLDGVEPVSGHNFFVEGSGLLFVSTFTRPEYRQQRAGVRAQDAAFEWGARMGFQHMDLGVGHEYKRRWAPASDIRWSFDVRPWHLHASAAVVRRGFGVGRATLNATRKALGIGRAVAVPDAS
jgi:GNAT superfamily N-acetyltransferase